MKYLISLFLIFFVITTVYAEETSDVITLTDSNFDEESKKHQYLLVEFVTLFFPNLIQSMLHGVDIVNHWLLNMKRLQLN
jgi:peptidoglycan biosynthesis protein MviN/MurJ (putative lipid II flippase)